MMIKGTLYQFRNLRLVYLGQSYNSLKRNMQIIYNSLLSDKTLSTLEWSFLSEKDLIKRVNLHFSPICLNIDTNTTLNFYSIEKEAKEIGFVDDIEVRLLKLSLLKVVDKDKYLNEKQFNEQVLKFVQRLKEDIMNKYIEEAKEFWNSGLYKTNRITIKEDNYKDYKYLVVIHNYNNQYTYYRVKNDNELALCVYHSRTNIL